jgi:hypothetical protein
MLARRQQLPHRAAWKQVFPNINETRGSIDHQWRGAKRIRDLGACMHACGSVLGATFSSQRRGVVGVRWVKTARIHVALTPCRHGRGADWGKRGGGSAARGRWARHTAPAQQAPRQQDARPRGGNVPVPPLRRPGADQWITCSPFFGAQAQAACGRSQRGHMPPPQTRRCRPSPRIARDGLRPLPFSALLLAGLLLIGAAPIRGRELMRGGSDSAYQAELLEPTAQAGEVK